MKSKTLITISIILVVLIGIWGVSQWQKSKPDTSAAGQLEFESLSIDNIDSISISKEEDTVTLQKDSGLWKVDEHNADSEKINSLFEDLKKLNISGPTSRNSENHEKFEVSDNKGTKLTFKQGDSEVASYIIGKQAAASQTSYIRKSNEDQVFIADANLRSLLPTKINDWRDKTVVRVNREQVKKVEFDYPEEKFMLSLQEDGTWQAIDDQGNSTTTEELLINRLFNNLNPLTADDFIEDEEGIDQFNTATSTQIIRLKGDNDSTVTELSLVKQGDAWWVKTSTKDTIYQAPLYRLSDVVINRKDLFEG